VPVWALVAVLILVLSNFTLYYSFDARGEQRGESKHAKSLATGFAAISPEAAFLAEWLVSTHQELDPLLGLDGNHHLTSYSRTVRVSSTDAFVQESYQGVNRGTEPSHGLRFAAFGGSLLSLEQLDARAIQNFEHGSVDINLRTRVNGERFKQLDASFRTPLLHGEQFSVGYSYKWPGAMVYGTDAIFLTPTLFYKRGVGHLRCEVSFDVPVQHIGGYSYNLQERHFATEASQPCQIRPSDTSFVWELEPRPGTLYFLVFMRPRPEEAPLTFRIDRGPAGCLVPNE
jgi:hypothetical protein